MDESLVSRESLKRIFWNKLGAIMLRENDQSLASVFHWLVNLSSKILSEPKDHRFICNDKNEESFWIESCRLARLYHCHHKCKTYMKAVSKIKNQDNSESTCVKLQDLHGLF